MIIVRAHNTPTAITPTLIQQALIATCPSLTSQCEQPLVDVITHNEGVRANRPGCHIHILADQHTHEEDVMEKDKWMADFLKQLYKESKVGPDTLKVTFQLGTLAFYE